MASLAALIAVLAATALIVHNDRAAPDAPHSNVLTADAAADGQCELLGYEGSADPRACHRGFVTGAMAARGEIPQSWSATTKRKVAYAAQLLLSQGGATFPRSGNQQMRSEAWIAGFKKGVLWTARLTRS